MTEFFLIYCVVIDQLCIIILTAFNLKKKKPFKRIYIIKFIFSITNERKFMVTRHA